MSKNFIPLCSSYISPNSAEIVSKVLASGMISEGALVAQFEKEFCTIFELNAMTTVNSGTSALHLALKLCGVGPGDEVILPAQTFVATGLVVAQERAIPVFCDVDPKDGNATAEAISRKISKRTKAIFVVHWGGMPCDLDDINAVAREHRLPVIEDAAHALGAVYRGKKIGQVSDYTCFSFQAIKHLTTGDGGGISCSDTSKQNESRVRRWFGIDRQTARPCLKTGERQYDISEVGFKYHMNDFAAALGLANIENVLERIQRRRVLAKKYDSSFSNFTGIKLFPNYSERISSYWMYGMHVDRRPDFIKALRARGIEASVLHQRIDRNSVFGGVTEGLEGQNEFNRTQVNIPIHDNLSDIDVERIIKAILAGW